MNIFDVQKMYLVIQMPCSLWSVYYHVHHPNIDLNVQSWWHCAKQR